MAGHDRSARLDSNRGHGERRRGMSSEPETPARPSIFLSYASADRPAARTIRETLAKAGLEVWLDEEELTGGEAWDAKIKQQIRSCTYFMPIISAATESRREGYFRREWRLAVERNLDMADDVTFLVPVVIDATSERTARVPERFLSVHWTQCPAGQENPALIAMAERLVVEFATGHRPRDHGPGVPAAQTPAGHPSRARQHPFPAFPPFPEKGHRERFVYNLVIWSGRMIYELWQRLPRWAQVLATILIIIRLVSLFLGNGSSPRDPDPNRSRPPAAPAPQDAGK
jgi:hypothetical protein